MAYTISRDSWHFRLYSYYHRDLCDRYEIVERVNLCPYMRTLFLWLPLRFAIYRLGLPLVIASWYVGGGLEFGFLKVGLAVLALILSVVAIVGAALLVVWVFENKRRKRRVDSEPKTIIGQWMKSKHDKICPVLEVR